MVTTTHSRCELLSAEDAWVYAGRPVCRSGWYGAIRRGEIPHIRMGRRLLIPRQALERLLSGELAAQGGGPDAA
jgi:excisionase family DNA binding protein